MLSLCHILGYEIAMTQSTIIIGAGAWGQALAYTCHKTNPQAPITLITKENALHNPHAILSKIDNIQFRNTLDKNTIQTHSAIIIATPSKAIAEVLTKLKALGHQGDLLCAAKGFVDQQTVLYPHELYAKINPKAKSFSYLYGPTFADEVLANQPTQAVLASSSKKSRLLWQKTLNNQDFQTIVSTDLKGLAWCSVFKNIVAIVSGCMRACNLGRNAQALLINHATLELNSIIKKIKGNPNTAFTLAGIGDIVLSASSSKSRNFQYGMQIASLKHHEKTTTEGKENLKLIHKKLKQLQKTKPTIMRLAEKCISQPQHCKTLIADWLRKKANRLQPQQSTEKTYINKKYTRIPTLEAESA